MNEVLGAPGNQWAENPDEIAVSRPHAKQTAASPPSDLKIIRVREAAAPLAVTRLDSEANEPRHDPGLY